MKITSEIGRLRIAGILEGFSWIALIITMVMKYGADMPGPNKITGMVHGVFFIGYVLLTFMAHSNRDWSFGKITWKLLLAAFLPFGTFYTDKKILAPMEEK